jgi:hypothetical protein
MKLSKWFKHPKQPDLVGWYEVRGLYIHPGLKLFWNGKQFGCIVRRNRFVWFPYFAEWRGLAEKPKEVRG